MERDAMIFSVAKERKILRTSNLIELNKQITLSGDKIAPHYSQNSISTSDKSSQFSEEDILSPVNHITPQEKTS